MACKSFELFSLEIFILDPACARCVGKMSLIRHNICFLFKSPPLNVHSL